MRTVRNEKPYLRINQIQIQYLLVLLGHAKFGFGTPLDLVSFLSLWCLAKNSVATLFCTWTSLYAHVVDYYACVHIVPSICLSVSIEYTDSVYWVGSQAGGAASRCLDMDSKQRGYTIGRGACSTKQDYICESRLHFTSVQPVLRIHACTWWHSLHCCWYLCWLVTTCEDLSCLRVEQVSGLIWKQSDTQRWAKKKNRDQRILCMCAKASSLKQHHDQQVTRVTRLRLESRLSHQHAALKCSPYSQHSTTFLLFVKHGSLIVVADRSEPPFMSIWGHQPFTAQIRCCTSS